MQLYMHFFIEHNFGHHLHAATPQDPATAKYNQSVYSFWFSSIKGQYIKAWSIQKSLLERAKLPFLSSKKKGTHSSEHIRPATPKELNKILVREKRVDLYKSCLTFLKTRVDLDLALFKDDIWSH